MKKERIIIIYFFFLILLVISCNPNYDMAGMFNGSSIRADKRFDESMAYNEKAGYAHITVPEDYRVYVATDTHVDSTTYNTEEFVKRFRTDPSCRIALHLGDLVNENNNHEKFFDAVRRASKHYYGKRDTIFYAVGNHDLYFNQWESYKRFVPTSTYWFDTRTVEGKLLDLYICIDSGEGTIGVKPMNWLKETLEEKSQQGYRHIIVFTHTHMFKKDNSQGHTSNYPLEETYDLTALFTHYHVDMYWSGHDHSRELTNYGNVTYIVIDTMQDPAERPYFMIADMGKDIKTTFVGLKD